MAIVIDRPSQEYAARGPTYNVNATVPGGVTVNSVKVSLTRESWPAGPVGSATLVFPDGDTASFSFSGGPAFNKDGSPLLASTVQFSRSNSGGVVPFPVGDYQLQFKCLQTVTTAVLVERF